MNGRTGNGRTGKGRAAAPERRVLRAVRIRLTLQTAGVITVVVLLLGCLTYCLFARYQRAEVNRSLQYALRSNRPGHDDPCTWLYVEQAGRIGRPAQSPAGLPLADAIRQTSLDHRTRTVSVARDGTHYAVRTEQRGNEVFQAVFDERYLRSARHQVLLTLLTAELVGLVLALVTGAGLARRAITPLGRALTRQREFVADASHELRAPLTRLHTRAQLLARQRSGNLAPETAGELERLVTGSRELAEVMDDLLLSASLDAPAAGRSRIDMGALAEAAVEAERQRAAQAQLTLHLTRSDEPIEVYGSASPLRRVLAALLDNAIGHSIPGGSIRVALRTSDEGHAVEVTVTDSGIGFDPADRRRIFERLTHSGEGRGRRYGIGLALVRNVVEAHGGTVSATGRPGEGAEFTVRLPAAGDSGSSRSATLRHGYGRSLRPRTRRPSR
ncbi:sensor histidine kinase [Streptacidiphilus sp. N1-12]|uniref:histidine kinase n=2 Tax=Streptacidiphilus alkalitolerans TaxID=3342712 RepID=A0ABV6W8W5_9ACTN